MTIIDKARRHILAVILAVIFAWLFVPGAWAGDITGEINDTFTVTRGAALESRQLMLDGAPCLVYILKIDLDDPYLNVRPLYGRGGNLENIQTVTGMAAEGGAVAAINADFFQMASGRPIGLTVRDGNIITSPAARTDMYGLGMYRGGMPQILVFDFSGQVTARDGSSFPLTGVNKPQYLLQNSVNSDVNSLQLYSPQWGSQSRGRVEGLAGARVEAVVRNGVVESLAEAGEPLSIPADGFVLAGHGDAAAWMLEKLKTGDRVKVKYSVTPGEELVSAIGGQSLLVSEGQEPTYFDQDIEGNKARSAAGYSRDGRYLYLVAVEGGAASRGMTQRELAGYLVSLGVWRAVNLDGGGSTTLVARPPGRVDVKAVNAPEKGTLRRVPTAWGLFTSAPAGPLWELVLEGPGGILSGDTGVFNALGIDKYYNPSPVDPQRVKWSLEGGGGSSVRGGKFVAGQGGSVNVTASVGRQKKTMAVRVVGAGDIESLIVEPSSIDVKAGEKVTLKVKVKTLWGDVLPLSPDRVNWTVPDGLGLLTGSEFNIPESAVQGMLKAEFLGHEVSVPLRVWLPEPEKPPVAELKDIKGHWAAGAIQSLAESNVVSGFPGGYFKPGDSVTRAQFVVMLKKALAWPDATNKPAFSDYVPEWCLGAVASAVNQGVVQGYPQGDFRPSSTITRTEMAVILNKILTGYGVKGTAKVPVYKDAGSVPRWGTQAVNAVGSAGLMKGDTAGRFRPLDTVTRAEAATVINALLEKYVNK